MDIKEYIKQYDLEDQLVLSELDAFISAQIPGVKTKISYGLPTYYTSENIIHFGCFKKHYGIFPSSSPIIHFKERLKDYKVTTGTIQIPKNKTIDYQLIKDIIEYRLHEIEVKGAIKNE